MKMEQQLLYERKNCNSKLFCKNCRPRLRRLEFEVSEMKLINASLKERLHGCELQSKDADQSLSGALSSSRRPSTNKSPKCFSNSSESFSNVQSYEFSSSASKAPVNLQKKLTEWTEQYGLLAHKYNEMVDRLQTCQDALHCSSKQNYELEKVNLELQIQLKEILQVKHSSNEDIFLQNLGVDQEFISFSIGSTPPTKTKEQSIQVDELNVSMPTCIHDGPIPPAACVRCVTSDYQRNMMPISSTESQNSTALPSDYYVSPPGFLRTQGTSLTSIPCVNMKAQVQDMAAPYSQPGHIDDGPQFAVSASELGWNPASNMVSLKNAIVMERGTPKKQQFSRQINTPLSQVTSPSDHCRLKKITNENIPCLSQADYSPISAFPNVCKASPTACTQSHDENGPTVINVPKIISIRANPHRGHLHGSDQIIRDEAAPALSPLDPNKSQSRPHHSTSIKKEVEKEVKVVALAENMECVAFPQGAYKTEMCNKWVKSMGQSCPYKDKCQFAHGPHELRPVLRHCRYKSILCRMVAAGEVCPYEHRCHFRHVIYPHEAELLSLN